MGREIKIREYFEEVETEQDYEGYYYSVEEALTIVILGSLCGLQNLNQIHQWAVSERGNEFLWSHFGIRKIPCYYWLLRLLKLVKPESLNESCKRWAQTMIGEDWQKYTISFDGKTICSTGKMESYERPMQIISAHVGELGITIAQKRIEEKSNEIPAMQELLKMLEITGSMIVADALNCQKETAKVVIEGKGDYLLSVKDNQKTLKEDIEGYVQDEMLRGTMERHTRIEKNSGRVEKRTGYVSQEIEWLADKEEWQNLVCIGAINTQFRSKQGESNEWHYYISSRKLTAEELLTHARLEWSVESMHWLLDVRFREDFCRIEDRNVQQNMNMIRKIALNTMKDYKNKTGSKRPMSRLMFDCLLKSENILNILSVT